MTNSRGSLCTFAFMFRLLLLGLFGYLVYRLYKFLRPFFIAVRNARNSINEVKQTMNQQTGKRSTQQQPKKSASAEGEYIDYEEVS